MGFHLNSPESNTIRRVSYCPICSQRRRFVVHLYAWYDPMFTCCGCGSKWNGTERMMNKRTQKHDRDVAQALWFLAPPAIRRSRRKVLGGVQ